MARISIHLHDIETVCEATPLEIPVLPITGKPEATANATAHLHRWLYGIRRGEVEENFPIEH